MTQIVRTSTSADYTASIGAGVAALLRGGDIVLLEGDLGAGKTAFVRGFAQALGVGPGLVSSPTFVVINEYPLGRGVRGILRLVHVDAYRLHSSDDLDAAGWDRSVDPAGSARPDRVIIVEWPARISGAFGASPDSLRIRLANLGDSTRRLDISLPQSFTKRPLATEFIEREPTRCPISGAWVEPTRTTYPFAGEREKLADLNRWFSGAYRIGRQATDADYDAAPREGIPSPDPDRASHDEKEN
ncbi:MAG: tRNA (adenosine(37)-N6)-threonylcarbamoyltransferase complex ATPase subunit type 1 TsaE [Phycisphaeraceae bacterium]|nr:tRNA (adenosine(37)-N6)-threonylcarbamoyltransferase complex ATPase subunit type 1 TsaE [Phycisphaeraceae bacterium]